ncbi:MAG: preprotein translocase subunit SecY [Anaerolineae bacterium]
MSLVQGIRDVFRLPDLRRRVLLTIGLLVLFRLAANIPVPGVDRVQLAAALDPATAGSNFIQVLNLLSGGAVGRFSVLAMGVYPYITASIIIQILTPFVPALEELQKQGQQGRQIIERWTMIFSIPLAMFQSVSQVNIFASILGVPPSAIVTGYGDDTIVTMMVIFTMTAGTMFSIWIGELNTKDGIGNGLSLIIFAGIMAQVPQSINLLIFSGTTGTTLPTIEIVRNLTVFIIIGLLTLFVIVIVSERQRRIPVKYGKRVRGMKMYGGGSTYLPLKVNYAGMIPLIFAQAVLTFPAVFAGFFANSEVPWIAGSASTVTNIFGAQGGIAIPGRVVYWVFYFAMVVGFTYLYTSIMIKNQNFAENLQRNGGFIPGVRPGKKTEEFINQVVNRITLVSALFLGILAIIPGIVGISLDLLQPGTGTGQQLQTSLIIVGGGGLIIVVGVVLDTMRQLEAQLVMRNRESFIR